MPNWNHCSFTQWILILSTFIAILHFVKFPCPLNVAQTTAYVKYITKYKQNTLAYVCNHVDIFLWAYVSLVSSFWTWIHNVFLFCCLLGMSVLTLMVWIQWDCKLGFKEQKIQSQNYNEINFLVMNPYSATIWYWLTDLEENANPLEKNSYWLHTRGWYNKVSLSF